MSTPTAPRTRTTILRDWQARGAAEGRLSMLAVPIRPQPPQPYPNGVGPTWEYWSDRDAFVPSGTLVDFTPEMRGGIKAPFRVGDVLIGREKWGEDTHDGSIVFYEGYEGPLEWVRWKSATSLQTEIARFHFTVKSIAVKRIREITDAEAIAVGVPRKLVNDPMFKPDAVEYGACGIWGMSPGTAFEWLWNEQHKDFPLKINPWLWLMGVERIGGAS